MAFLHHSILAVLVLLSASVSSFVVPTGTNKVAAFSKQSTGLYLSASPLEEDTGALTELEINDIKVGEGEASVSGDVIRGDFDLKVIPSTESLSSGDFCIRLGDDQVIRGWDDGMVGLKKGGKRVLKIPASMAYGEQGKGSIPPNSDLEITIEVSRIAKTDFDGFLAQWDLGANPRTFAIFGFLFLGIFAPQIFQLLGIQ